MAETPSEGQVTAPVAPEGSPTTPPVSFKDSLPEALRAEKSLETIADVETLAKNYVEARKYIGGTLKIPAKEAPADEWHNLFTKLGKPESAQGYSYQLPDLPEGVEVEAKGVEGFLRIAHDLHLLPSQVQGVINWVYGDVLNQGLAANRAATEAGQAEMQKLWPGALMQKNVTLAKRLISTVGGDEMLAQLEHNGLANNAPFMKMMARLAQRMVEDNLIAGDVDGIPTVNSARAEIDKYIKDKSSPYWNAKDPNHKAVFERVKALYDFISGGQS